MLFNPERIYKYYYILMLGYADKPILVSETTVGAMDRGTLHPNSDRPGTRTSEHSRMRKCSIAL